MGGMGPISSLSLKSLPQCESTDYTRFISEPKLLSEKQDQTKYVQCTSILTKWQGLALNQ